MRRLLRSGADQARGGARLSTQDLMMQLAGPGPGTTTSTAPEPAPATTTIPGVTAAVGDVRLTIRSSKSALSESPFGPSASIGIVWAMGNTQAHSTRMAVTSSLARIEPEHTPILNELPTPRRRAEQPQGLSATRTARPGV